MRSVASQYSGEFSEESYEPASNKLTRHKVRLPFFTWEGLGVAAVLLALCVVFAEEDVPPPKAEGEVTLNGHFGLVGTINFSPDGETLLSSSWDKTVRLWEVGALPQDFGGELARLPGNAEIYDAVMSPDCKTVATAGMNGLTLWDWNDEAAFPENHGDIPPSRALAFSPDGRTLALGGVDCKVRLFDLKTRRVTTVLEGHVDAIRKVLFGTDDSLLISLSYDGGLKFWDIQKNREIQKIKGPSESVLAFCMSPDGQTIALSRYGLSTGDIELWDLASGRLRARCQGHDGDVHALTFSHDGGTLASAASDLQIRFWNAATGGAAGLIEDSVGWVRVLQFSVDGRWLAYSGARSRVSLKRIELPRLITRAEPPPGPATPA